jgi:hypothetical protein
MTEKSLKTLPSNCHKETSKLTENGMVGKGQIYLQKLEGKLSEATGHLNSKGGVLYYTTQDT